MENISVYAEINVLVIESIYEFTSVILAGVD